MAKSIRSKHRRRMRNVKRQHYAKKDLERLKRIAAKSSELDSIVTMKSIEEIKEKKIDQEAPKDSTTDSTMEVEKTVRVFNKATMQDENGHYPEWMNQRAIKKQKQKVKQIKIKKKVGKVGKKIKW